MLLPLLACALGACEQIDDTVLGVAVNGASDGGSDGGASPFPFYTAAQVAAAQAGCQAITSAVTPVSSVAQETSLLLGSWLSCTVPTDLTDASAEDSFISNVDGIQFTSGGEVRFLVLDPGGNLTNGVSPIHLVNPQILIPSSTIDGGADGARISYSILPFTDDAVNNVSGQVNITYADRTSGGYFYTFESSPRRLSADYGDSYVYIGP